MKYAHSVMMGDLVHAEHWSHEECKELLLICPVCSQKVFKRVTTIFGNVVHMFCHHHKTPQSDDCALRVERMSRQDLVSASNIARGQTYEVFFQNVYQIIVHSLTDSDEAAKRLMEDADKFSKQRNFNYWYRKNMADYGKRFKTVFAAYTGDEGFHERASFQRRCLFGQTIWMQINEITRPYTKDPIAPYLENSTVSKDYRKQFILHIFNILMDHTDKVNWKQFSALAMVWYFKLADPANFDQKELSDKFYSDIAVAYWDPDSDEVPDHFAEEIGAVYKGLMTNMMLAVAIPLYSQLKFDKLVNHKSENFRFGLANSSMSIVEFFVAMLMVIPTLPRFRETMERFTMKQDTE